MIAIVIDAIRYLAAGGDLPADLSLCPLEADTEIERLAIDSLGKLALLTELEVRADVALSESLLGRIRTLGDLAAAVDTARGEQ